MISYAVDDVKLFMNHLLRSSLFDDWELREAKLHTLCRYTISGNVNTAFLSDEEKANREHSYLLWEELRSNMNLLIKGKRSPSLFHVVLAFPLNQLPDLQTDTLESLLLNIHFENGILTLITAASLKTFSMDRSFEQYWDSFVPQFFAQHGILLRKSES